MITPWAPGHFRDRRLRLDRLSDAELPLEREQARLAGNQSNLPLATELLAGCDLNIIGSAHALREGARGLGAPAPDSS